MSRAHKRWEDHLTNRVSRPRTDDQNRPYGVVPNHAKYGMFGNLLKKIGSLHREILSGPDNKLTISKVQLWFGFWFLSFFVWKLIITHTLTIDYFVVYAGFVSGHSLVSKYIDSKGNQLTAGAGGDDTKA